MATRRSRCFRPLVRIAEQFAPASALVPGLPTGTVERTAGEGAGNDLGMAQSGGTMEPSILPATAALVPSIQPQALTGIATTGGDQGSSSTDSSVVPAAPERESASDRGLFENLIALVTPAESTIPSESPAAAPSAARAMPQPQSGRGAPAPNPIPVAPAATPPATAPSAATTALPGASPTAGIIRPMALAPSQPTAGAATVPGVHSPAPGAGHPGGRVGTGRGHRVGIGQGVAMASGSGSGSGSGTGDPYITYSGTDGADDDTRTSSTVNDLTGDNVSVTVHDNKGYQISTVSWSISSSTLYSSQSINSRSGFTNVPYTPPQNVQATSTSFDWGEQPGNYTITADVTYEAPGIKSASVTLYANIQKMPGTITLNSVGTPTLSGNGISELYSTSASRTQAGIKFTLSVNPTVLKQLNLTGTFQVGIIQTIQPLSEYYKFVDAQGVTETWTTSVYGAWPGSQSLPRPVTDDATGDAPVQFTGTFYGNNILNVDASMTSASSPFTDTPYIKAASTDTYMQLKPKFTDTLMIKPPGAGIWVPLGYFTWSVSLAATGSGPPANTWVSNSGIGVTPGSYANSNAYPTWNDSNYYLWSTYNQFVRTS